MNSTDGVNKAPKLISELRRDSAATKESKNLAKTAEEYVEIENRLAAQREKPKPGSQLDSIFDQLRGRLPK